MFRHQLGDLAAFQACRDRNAFFPSGPRIGFTPRQPGITLEFHGVCPYIDQYFYLF